MVTGSEKNSEPALDDAPGDSARVEASWVLPVEAGEPSASKLLREAIEAGVEAMLVLQAARNEHGEAVDFEIVGLNASGAQLLGISRADAVGRLIGEIVPEFREEGYCRTYTRVLETGKALEQEFHVAPGGFQQIWIRQRVVPLSDGVAVFASDISEVKRTADAGDRSKRMFQQIAASTPDLHALWDVGTRRFLYSNRNFFELLGYPSDGNAIVKLSLMERILHPDDVQRFKEHVNVLSHKKDDEVQEGTFRFQAADATPRWLLFRESVFEREAGGKPKTILCTAQDTTRQRAYEAELEASMSELRFAREELETRQRELEELNQKLGHLALTDGLTGLKNHRAFQERLSEEVERAHRYGAKLSLVMVDLDHFKSINDRFGHPAGDNALRAFATVLLDAARSSDLVVRYGGEEFALILPNTGALEAANLAERVRAGLQATEYGGLGVTASFGCAEAMPGREAKERLMADADRALYQSKAAGRDRVTISSSNVEPSRPNDLTS